MCSCGLKDSQPVAISWSVWSGLLRWPSRPFQAWRRLFSLQFHIEVWTNWRKARQCSTQNHTVRDWTLQAKVNIDCCYSSLVTHVLHQKGLSTISNLNPIECYTPDTQWPEIWRPGCSQVLRQPAPEMPTKMCHQWHVGTQWKPAWADEAFAKVSGFGRSIICMIEPPPRDGRMTIEWFLRDPLLYTPCHTWDKSPDWDGGWSTHRQRSAETVHKWQKQSKEV